MSSSIIRISDLICQNMRLDSIPDCSSNLSRKISDSLIKVASTRIFSEPEQSFMELPVNSIDSYNSILGNKPIGKFGMGFFSILYWLSENPNRNLIITSKYANEPKYTIQLNWTPNGLTLKYLSPDPLIFPNNETGTQIYLDCRNGNLTDNNISRITKYINRLSNIQGINIFYNLKKINKSISNFNVNIYANIESVTVIDKAQGISKDILFNSLLVPSSSSKRRIQDLEIRSPTTSRNNNPSSILMVTVNNVSIIRIEKYFPLFNPGIIYVIKMPSDSHLPVARDDIIYDFNEANNITDQLSQLYSLAINIHMDLTVLFNLLDEYTKQSRQIVLTNIIRNFKESIYSFQDIIYIPTGYEAYSHIKRMYPERIFVYHPNPRIDILNKQIDQLLDYISDKNIFNLKKIIPLSITKNYETGGLSNYLFINLEYIKDPNWGKNLISSSKNTLFIPIDIKNDGLSEYYEKIGNVSKEFKETFDTLVMTWVAKIQNINFDLPEYRYVILDLVNLYMENDDDKISLMTYFNSKLSTINFQYSYGSNKRVYVNYNPIFFDYRNIKPKNEEVKQSDNYPEIYGEYMLLLDQLQIKLAYWYCDIWELSPNGIYIIPTHDIFYITGIYGAEFFGTIEEDFLIELISGLKSCITEAEILTFLGIMYKYNKEYIEGNNIGIGKFCLQQIRYRASAEELTEIVKGVLLNYNTHLNFITKITDPVLIALNLYTRKSVILTPIYIPPLENGYVFSCKSLISYIYNNPEPINFSETSLRKLQRYNQIFIGSSVKLQIVEIAVNEGTTKNYMQAVLTELVQNSIDAIRSSKIEGEIHISLRRDGIIISDNVGISDFLSLLIPFLSSKNPNDPNVTGEIGTGFFNIYRQPFCKRARIYSTLNNKTTIVDAIPSLENGKVYNIQYSMRQYLETRKNGTEITIIFNPLSEIIEAITDAHLFANNYLGFTGIKTYLDNVLIEQKMTSVFQNNLGTISIIEDHKIQSFVMTNNIPFSSLSFFASDFPNIYNRFLEDSDMRIIIDFNKNVYRPSQSRTKVNIDDKLKRKITSFINDGLYLSILTMYSNSQLENSDAIIANTTSTSNIEQLKFSPNDKNIYVNYIYKKGKKSLGEIINDYISSIIASYNTGLKFVLESDPVSNSVRKWISNKNLTPEIREVIVLKQEQNKSTIIIENKAISSKFRILQPFIDEYWRICHELVEESRIIGINLNSIPLIVIGNTKNSAKGYYSEEQNIIFLNEKYFDEKEITKKILKIKDIYKENSEEAIYNMRMNLGELFSPTIPITTLIHEILHALQKDDHLVSSHGITNIQIDGRGNLSFDESANAIYQEVLKRGLMNNYLYFISSNSF